eukprot:CAMPEP_0204118164 /NCGR_PEP_ID=MMETSP0361-20130328/6384_1 /ASSEMBLY_ACC=CAM_ASM_000343 /TAXON_ID=268821 /ORGANISM="Scrippsiella Hangoei, Strain SHTV-5" /LENGTH=503 /DNA_ID=CAMNT_0051069141 /DNA_START=51 /DNA_END=1562 /DNA_ORIENTATION=+
MVRQMVRPNLHDGEHWSDDQEDWGNTYSLDMTEFRISQAQVESVSKAIRDPTTTSEETWPNEAWVRSSAATLSAEVDACRAELAAVFSRFGGAITRYTARPGGTVHLELDLASALRATSGGGPCLEGLPEQGAVAVVALLPASYPHARPLVMLADRAGSFHCNSMRELASCAGWAVDEALDEGHCLLHVFNKILEKIRGQFALERHSPFDLKGSPSSGGCCFSGSGRPPVQGTSTISGVTVAGPSTPQSCTFTDNNNVSGQWFAQVQAPIVRARTCSSNSTGTKDPTRRDETVSRVTKGPPGVFIVDKDKSPFGATLAGCRGGPPGYFGAALPGCRFGPSGSMPAGMAMCDDDLWGHMHGEAAQSTATPQSPTPSSRHSEGCSMSGRNRHTETSTDDSSLDSDSSSDSSDEEDARAHTKKKTSYGKDRKGSLGHDDDSDSSSTSSSDEDEEEQLYDEAVVMRLLEANIQQQRLLALRRPFIESSDQGVGPTQRRRAPRARVSI